MEDWRLYWSPQSSAALRVVLALRAKGMLPANMPICQPNRAHPHPTPPGAGSTPASHCGSSCCLDGGRLSQAAFPPPARRPTCLTGADAAAGGGDGNGYAVEAEDGSGLVEYRTINPEGRVPALAIGSGAERRFLTQAAAIVEYMEEEPSLAGGPALLPTDPWARARVRQICWLLGADTHPIQNMGMIATAVRDFGMPADKSGPMGGLKLHPFRQHFLRREFAALDGIVRCQAPSRPRLLHMLPTPFF